MVRKKKLMYRRLVDTGSEDARRHYNEVNVEARIVVRINKNDEWIQLGTELEKDAWGNQWRYWARVNGSKEARDRMQQICGSDGRVLVGVEKNILRGCMGLQTDQVIRHCTCREATLEGETDIVKEEVRRGVRRLKGRKAVGMCGIVPEMLKAGGEVVMQWLTEFFNMLWRVGVEECSNCSRI